MSRVTCHIFFLLFFLSFLRQGGEAYRWRVCYQRGLPRLVCPYNQKLDGVGLIGNRPYPDYLNSFVKKKWCVTPDTWQLAWDTWQVILDTWHMTYDTWWGVTILSIFQLPSFYGLGVYDVLKVDRKRIGHLMNYWVTQMFVEQPWLHWIC